MRRGGGKAGGDGRQKGCQHQELALVVKRRKDQGGNGGDQKGQKCGEMNKDSQETKTTTQVQAIKPEAPGAAPVHLQVFRGRIVEIILGLVDHCRRET